MLSFRAHLSIGLRRPYPQSLGRTFLHFEEEKAEKIRETGERLKIRGCKGGYCEFSKQKLIIAIIINSLFFYASSLPYGRSPAHL